LNPEEKTQLAKQIAAQLNHHPPRFSRSTWFDD
jgi:hypothetical protein